MYTLLRSLVIIVMFIFSGAALNAQVSVYFCTKTGAYGYCYGDTYVRTCAYNKCVEYGGRLPQEILYVSYRSWVAIVEGKDARGARAVSYTHLTLPTKRIV